MRQQIRPIHIGPYGTRTALLQKRDAIEEKHLQELIHDHPEILPMAAIDPAYMGAVSICRELGTPAGPIDNLLITPTGLPVLVECKLWKNPDARRVVVGQALDYAKELARWTSADLEREASRRGVPSLAERVREWHPDLDDAIFYDTLTRSLARGRVLLLIVGDGIKESVEAIFESLEAQGALQFSLGLVEMPLFDLPDGSMIAVPRTVAHSVAHVRQVIQLPEGLGFRDEDEADDEDLFGDRRATGDRHEQFWGGTLRRLALDDPEQPVPDAVRKHSIAFSMPVPDKCCWLSLYRAGRGEVGLFLSRSKDSPAGGRILDILLEDQDDILAALGGEAILGRSRAGGETFRESRDFGDLDDPDACARAQAWLAERTNRFVNVLRPAVRRAVDMMRETGETG